VRNVVTVEQMRALEQAAAEDGLPGPALMENAGRAVGDAIRARFPAPRARSILVLVGPGNNGGDALVAARHLADDGRRVSVYQVDRKQAADAKTVLLQERAVPVRAAAEDPDLRVLDVLLESADVVVDGLLGAGRLRPIAAPLADIVDRVNRRSPLASVVAVDVPSGINADTGEVDPHAIRADLTVTLGCPKLGLFVGAASRLVGELEVVDIGIPGAASDAVETSFADDASIAALLPDRPRVSHKGSYGKILVVAGSRLYTGAAVLASVGAERVGAGLVTLACPASVRESLAVHTVETTFLPLPDDGDGALVADAVQPAVDAARDYSAVLVGPGIGRSPRTLDFLLGLLDQVQDAMLPTVIDADALTLLATRPRWWELLPVDSIITPHPGEMARLSGQSEPSDRIAWARQSAARWRCIVVLKGAFSVVARPDGVACVLPFANPALATAGTGDVLAGAIVGFLGQRLAAPTAALVGAYVHGIAGELVRTHSGGAGGLAGDVARELPAAMRQVRESRQRSLLSGGGQW
jgi:NAD(P)H-hydrate epimerase